MATYEFNFYAQVVYQPENGLYQVVTDGGDFSGTVTDNDSGSGQFTADETVSVSGVASVVFVGTVTIGGEVYVMTTTLTANRFYLFGEVADPQNLTLYEYIFYSEDIDRAPFTVCFAAGTPIATPAGEVAVETLRAGDLVLTADGRAVAVKWLARQTVHKVFTPELRFRPVRLRTGALAENVPHADLVVTADHGLVLDGLVVQAGALVNGTTIDRVPMAELGAVVTYYHVETEHHDAILAAGAPAETFVDNVTRRRFDNYAEYEALHGDIRGTVAEMGLPRVKSARQVPRALRERLEARAETLADRTMTAA